MAAESLFVGSNVVGTIHGPALWYGGEQVIVIIHKKLLRLQRFNLDEGKV